jgi:hypothetical protein
MKESVANMCSYAAELERKKSLWAGLRRSF